MAEIKKIRWKDMDERQKERAKDSLVFGIIVWVISVLVIVFCARSIFSLSYEINHPGIIDAIEYESSSMIFVAVLIIAIIFFPLVLGILGLVFVPFYHSIFRSSKMMKLASFLLIFIVACLLCGMASMNIKVNKVNEEYFKTCDKVKIEFSNTNLPVNASKITKKNAFCIDFHVEEEYQYSIQFNFQEKEVDGKNKNLYLEKAYKKVDDEKTPLYYGLENKGNGDYSFYILHALVKDEDNQYYFVTPFLGKTNFDVNKDKIDIDEVGKDIFNQFYKNCYDFDTNRYYVDLFDENGNKTNKTLEITTKGNIKISEE